MAVLSASQQQQYLNLINEAPIHKVTRLKLVNVIEYSDSIDKINELCVRTTKIDIAKFQAITNPVQFQSSPAAPVAEEVTPVAPAAPVVEEVTPVAPVVPVKDETTTTPESLVEQTPPVKKYNNFGFNKAGGKVDHNKIVTPQNAEVKPALKFFTCDDNQVKRDVAAVVNEGTRKALAEAINECAAWAKSNNDLYLYNNNTCEKVFDTTKAESICYMNIIPKNIAPKGETGVAVYSCDENNDSYIKQSNPFTYLYSSEEGKAQHLRDCAEWMATGGSALAFGENNCTSFFEPNAILTGCINPQE